MHRDECRFEDCLKLLRHILTILARGLPVSLIVLILTSVRVLAMRLPVARVLLLWLNVSVLLVWILLSLSLSVLGFLVLYLVNMLLWHLSTRNGMLMVLLLRHTLDRVHIGCILRLEMRRVTLTRHTSGDLSSSLLRLRHLLLGYIRLWHRCYHDFVVLIAVFVPHFLLVIGTSPLTIDDILVLVFPRSECLGKFELVIATGYSLHSQALLPVAE